MKNHRQHAIVDMIREHSIGTQDELALRLKSAGFQVTQATVSRDIRELRLQKVPTVDGYRYALPAGTEFEPSERLHNIFRESVLSVACAGNIVVVKTLSGLAGAAFAAIDSMKLDMIVGTLAGDDTGFIVTTDASHAEALRIGLEKLTK